jgi:hypothetical protein
VSSGLQTNPVTRLHLAPADRNGMIEPKSAFSSDAACHGFDGGPLALRSHYRCLNGQLRPAPRLARQCVPVADGSRARLKEMFGASLLSRFRPMAMHAVYLGLFTPSLKLPERAWKPLTYPKDSSP